MRGSPQATEIILTVEERQQPEAPIRSKKCDARTRLRARIVLLAAAGTGTRKISRQLRCTIGTASTWRLRYARDRLAGLPNGRAMGASHTTTSGTQRRHCSTGRNFAVIVWLD
jgi:hypothetical protein